MFMTNIYFCWHCLVGYLLFNFSVYRNKSKFLYLKISQLKCIEFTFFILQRIDGYLKFQQVRPCRRNNKLSITNANIPRICFIRNYYSQKIIFTSEIESHFSWIHKARFWFLIGIRSKTTGPSSLDAHSIVKKFHCLNGSSRIIHLYQSKRREVNSFIVNLFKNTRKVHFFGTALSGQSTKCLYKHDRPTLIGDTVNTSHCKVSRVTGIDCFFGSRQRDPEILYRKHRMTLKESIWYNPNV